MSFIGNEIAKLRKQKKMAQQDLATKSGVDYETLRKVEKGKTKKPSYEFIQKICKTLGVEPSSLTADERPIMTQVGVYDFQQLSAERFEELVIALLLKDESFETRTIEHFGGTGDKGRDVVSKRIKNEKVSSEISIFQAKKTKSIGAADLIRELDKMHKYFIADKNRPSILGEIFFFLAASASADTKDKVKKKARDLGLPEPIFWDKRMLQVMCEKNHEIAIEFFNGTTIEVLMRQKKSSEIASKNHEELTKKLVDINFAITSSQEFQTQLAKDDNTDPKMREALRFINEKKYEEALETLLSIQDNINKNIHIETQKRFYNNLGVCYTKLNLSNGLEKGLEFLLKALDLDPDFNAPKINLAATYINNNLIDYYPDTLRLTQGLYKSEPDNLEYIALHLSALRLNNKTDTAQTIIESRDDICKEILRSELFAIEVIMALSMGTNQIEKARNYALKALTVFEDSVLINKFLGDLCLINAKSKSRTIDILPFVFGETALDAIRYYEKALTSPHMINMPLYFITQIQFGINICYAILSKTQSTELEKFSKYKYLTSQINHDHLNEIQVEYKHLIDIGLELEQNRDYAAAYRKYEGIKHELNLEYDGIKNFAEKFYGHGSPEYAIKILLPIRAEAIEKRDFEYWILLSTYYALHGDKNSALRELHQALNLFSQEKDIIVRIKPHELALLARYADEDDRIISAAFELDHLAPDKQILSPPITAIDQNGGLTLEVQNLINEARNNYKKRRTLFQTSPFPICWLSKLFCTIFPKAIQIPKIHEDFQFTLPYNSMDALYLQRQLNLFEKHTVFAIDYGALLNFARAGQLGLFSALNKRIIISEYLLFTIQSDLLHFEDSTLRNVWDFIRSDGVEIISHRDFEKNALPTSLQSSFDTYFLQQVDYCLEKKICMLVDDLSLVNYLNSSEVNVDSITSFVFFDSGLKQGILDKKQYSLILGSLAELFYQFIPCDGEDLLYIAIDDISRIEHKTIAWGYFRENPDLKISSRLYHLLNQVNLPGSQLQTFLIVNAEFLTQVFKRSFLEKEKIDWALFFSNFFGKQVSFEPEQGDPYFRIVGFIAFVWKHLLKSLPISQHPQVLASAQKIINIEIRTFVCKELEDDIKKSGVL